MTKESPKKPKAKDTKTTHKKVFDVTPPGKSLALPNSRSVIMGHKRQVQDDQFVPGGSSSSNSDPSPASPAKKTEDSSRQTAPRLAGNPSEKYPLLDSHKKIDLKPGTDSDGASKEDVSSGNIAGLAPMSPEATTAPVLPENVAAPAPIAPTTSKDKAVETPLSSDPSSLAGTGASTAPLVPSNTNTANFGAHDNMTTSDLLADLAVEQVVDPPGFEPSSAKADGSVSAGTTSDSSSTGARNDGAGDLLAETGAPDLSPQKAVVSTHHHRGSFFRIVLTFLLILIVGVVALNFLLDAGIIETELDLPYTDLIK